MSDLPRTQKDKTDLQGNKNILQDKDLFNGNVFLIYLVKKTERLSAALHLLTGRWGHDEPLRTDLRDASLRLVCKLARSSRAQGEGVDLQDMLAQVSEIVSLLSVAASAGLIAVENVEILESEYRKVAGLALERLSELKEASLSPRYFDTAELELPEREIQRPAFEPYISAHRYRGEAVPGVNLMNRRPVSSRRPAGPDVVRIGGSSERREQVLSVIDSKGKVTIRDIAGVIQDCSEKTIQRELAVLVSEGVLRREGERRWSTYSRVS